MLCAVVTSFVHTPHPEVVCVVYSGSLSIRPVEPNKIRGCFINDGFLYYIIAIRVIHNNFNWIVHVVLIIIKTAR